MNDQNNGDDLVSLAGGGWPNRPSRTDRRKAKLKDALVAAAEARIIANGFSELRARDLAQDVGCSVGAAYGGEEDRGADGVESDA